MMSLSVIQGAFELGMILAVMAIGMYISFKVLNTPDLTVDGSFTLGAAVSAVFASSGMPFLGILMSILAGGIAGMVTGLLQTKLRINPILSGILTMTALYSINLRIMGKPNIPLFNQPSVFQPLKGILPDFLTELVPLLLVLVLAFVVVRLFLRTQVGMSIRATGDNEDMVRASSINSDFMKILGLAVSNMLVSLSGALFAQYQAFADIQGGIGMMVIGLASIIVGDAFCGHGGVTRGMIAAVVGAILYRFLLTLALQIGLDSNDLKLFSALLVVIAISIPAVKNIVKKWRGRHA